MSSDLPPLVPREVLLGNPDKVQPRISPDGTRLAYLAPRDGVLNVWVGKVGAPEEGFRAVTDDTDRGIRLSSGRMTTAGSCTRRTRVATRTCGYTTLTSTAAPLGT